MACSTSPQERGKHTLIYAMLINYPVLVAMSTLTCAMLVMKKGSQVLKKSPSRTPRVRLAFSALRPCR